MSKDDRTPSPKRVVTVFVVFCIVMLILYAGYLQRSEEIHERYMRELVDKVVVAINVVTVADNQSDSNTESVTATPAPLEKIGADDD